MRPRKRKYYSPVEHKEILSSNFGSCHVESGLWSCVCLGVVVKDLCCEQIPKVILGFVLFIENLTGDKSRKNML